MHSESMERFPENDFLQWHPWILLYGSIREMVPHKFHKNITEGFFFLKKNHPGLGLDF
jgi:hypothetical protein